MSAIVAALVYVPLALLVGGIALVFDVSPRALASFGESMPASLGLLLWWLLVFLPSCVYVTLVSRI